MLRQTQPRPRMDCAGRAVLAALILQRIRTSNMKDQVKTDDRVLAPHGSRLASATGVVPGLREAQLEV